MPQYGQPDADMLENISAAIIVDQPKAGRQFALDRSDGDRHELRLSQPSVSKHLRLLREAGFVVQRIEAQRRLSRLRPEPIIELDAWLVPFRRFWSKHVDALEQRLEKMEKVPSVKGKKRHEQP
jgi:DNA-binding transcriptional ArsR family regulator